MHLQRVQVPDFRVLKDVDITFEKDFNPRVFPLGSQNGGGKSTLLQLVFILLHCSTNPERLPALKNLLSGFDLRDGEDKKILAIIDIWEGEKLVQLEFFVCQDNYINKALNLTGKEEKKLAASFLLFTHLQELQQKISGFQNQENQLKNILRQFENRQSSSSPYKKFPDDLKIELLNLNINFDSIEIEFSDPNFLSRIEKETKAKLQNEHRKIEIQSQVVSEFIDEMLILLKSENTEYITVYPSLEEGANNRALLCHINNLDMDAAKHFLSKLSNKIFLAAPSTQVFLFLSQKSRRSLFRNSIDYYSDLMRANSMLSGLFTYNLLAIEIIIAAFKKARDSDFKEALETGEYGNNYKKLLNDLDFLTYDKQINLTTDFSGITFKINRFTDTVELYPEDLSHGELKRLNVYIWLKSQYIQDAIVLMDEVDLALHPDWQYQIVSDLVEWEPSNQYILATHSYDLCQALTPSHVKVLEPKLTERISGKS
jgi:energy-coupling factor transporter ATP-binding protein EcfA2